MKQFMRHGLVLQGRSAITSVGQPGPLALRQRGVPGELHCAVARDLVE